MLVLSLIIFDSKRFFSKELVILKLRHQSGQHDWNIHFPQSIVYQNSPFRYQSDFRGLKEVVELGSIVISDLATSYYAAATLPVYIRNSQPHQGRRNFKAWASLFDKLDFCYLDNPQRMEKAVGVIRQEVIHNPERPVYFLLNKDGLNKNNHLDCMANRSEYIELEILKFTKKVYVGEHLDLFQVNNSFF